MNKLMAERERQCAGMPRELTVLHFLLSVARVLFACIAAVDYAHSLDTLCKHIMINIIIYILCGFFSLFILVEIKCEYYTIGIASTADIKKQTNYFSANMDAAADKTKQLEEQV